MVSSLEGNSSFYRPTTSRASTSTKKSDRDIHRENGVDVDVDSVQKQQLRDRTELAYQH